MCRKVLANTTENARGFFLKGNEPEPMLLRVIVAPCECGEVWYARTPTGIVWVEAEKMSERDVDAITEKKLIDDIGRLSPVATEED